MLRPAVLVASLASLASARVCQDALIHVSISARNANFNLSPLVTAIDTSNWALESAKQGANYTDAVLDGYATIEGDYKLATTYCEPDDGPGDTVQLLTHGVGFDRSYWDLPFNNYNYSYVARAVDERGYATLSWDRLGVGHSSHGDTINEIQQFLEIEALRALTEKLADGSLCNGGGHAFEKVVHVGHSFGSAMTYNLANLYPELSAGIILTGFSHVGNFISGFILGANFGPVGENPLLADKYEDGYIAPTTKAAVHQNFFASGAFDPKMLDFAWENGQANTPAELMTVGAGLGVPNVFEGPALVITGDHDLPFCGSDCSNTAVIEDAAPNLVAVSGQLLSKATPFNATVVPGSGHALNMEYTHPFTHEAILDFLDTNL